VTYDDELVRSLLREQHPDLAGLSLRPVDGGWDSQMWRLGDDLGVRLPRTARCPELLARERRWLPVLAPHLPLPVPVPVREGQPSATFPNLWNIVAWVPGEPADRSPIRRGPELAGFLRALHRTAPADAPVSADRGRPLTALTPRLADWAEVLDGEPAFNVAEVVAAWERAVAVAAWPGPPVWLHGDLHPANVLVTDGALAGVVDFGDMCAGDPATDLSAAWLLLPTGTAGQFFQTYASADEATIERARGWAILRAVGLIAIGRNGELGLPGGKPSWLPAGRAALTRALATL
jgi:aminoglycoside phosphotransferase (APT) family kinase protein